MISRRSFLKLTGAAAAALTAGFGAGNLLSGRAEYSAIVGFLPADKHLFNEFVSLFNRQTGSSLSLADISLGNHPVYLTSGNSGLYISPLSQAGFGDIMVTDNVNTIYDPAKDYSYMYTALRDKISSRQAAYFVSAEYKKAAPLQSLLGHTGKKVIIENESGTFDEIKLAGGNIKLNVPGPLGLTGISIQEGTVKVHKPVCRNKRCTHTRGSSIIACAPNKLIIKIV